MRKVNYLLLIGTFILLFLVAVSMFPEFFTKVDPYGKQFEKLTYEAGKFKGATPPIAPCEEFPWGTDTLGRDMKSLIAYGCKATLSMTLLIALGRLLIALPLSIFAAYKNKLARWIIREFNVVFGAIPLIIICVFFAQTYVTIEIFNDRLIPVAIMLTIFGWGKMANIITQSVTEVLSQDFIEGETAIGKTRLEIAIQNILPHLIPNLMVLIFLEMALILVSLAQIGILNTIIYNGFTNEYGNMNTPLEFDWPSLFIFSYYLFGSDKMWLVIYPALAFSISIIGFNLLGEGLRLEFDKKNSMVISFIKKIPTILSPMRFIYQIKNFRDYRSPVIKKISVIVLIIVIVAIPGPQNAYVLDTQGAFNEIEALNALKHEDKESYDFEVNYANTISKKLETFGLLPFDEKYLHEFTSENKQITDSSISIDSDNKNIQLEYKTDYWIQEYVPVDDTYDMELIKADQIKNISNARIEELRNKIIAIDIGDDIKTLLFIEYEIVPKGVIFINPNRALFSSYEAKQSGMGTNVIFLQSDKSEQLLGISNAKVNISVHDAYREGINVAGYIPGSDEQLKDEYIVIGSPINYLQNSTEEYRTSEIGGTSLALEIAEAVQKYGIKPKRTLVFVFWGGDTGAGRGSISFVKKYFDLTEKNSFYIDLKDLTNMQTNELIVDTSLIMPKSKIGQEYIKILKKYADINNIKLNYGSISSPYAKDFYDNNRQAMVISSSRKGPIFDKLYRNNGQINQNKYNKAAQMIFNAVVEMEQKVQ